MAKSKYTPTTVQKILEAIARDGCDESGWLAGGISQATFYSWQKQYPEFLESVVRVKEEFRQHCPEEQSKKARAKLNDALENGQIIKWETKRELEIEYFNAEGDLKGKQLQREKTEHIEHRPTPQWAIDRVVPKPLNTIEQILAAASEYGCTLVVKDADLFNRYLQETSSNDSQGNSKQGLTEEEAAEIRAKILGLAE